MTALLIAGAMLCGIPLGFIMGLLAGAKIYRETRRIDDVPPEHWGV